MSLIQQYQIELSKARKEFKDLQCKIQFKLTGIAERSNPFNFDDIESIKTDELKMLIDELIEAKEKALAVQKKIKELERELF